MISNGNVTVLVSNMDAALRFYTQTLGLTLIDHFGDHWATVRAGETLTIGLHPRSAKFPAPGTKGAMMIGLEISEHIEDVKQRLESAGVRIIGEIQNDAAGRFLDFEDPDGNALYLWEIHRASMEAAENQSQAKHKTQAVF